MSRDQSISHYLERCYDKASLIAALSTARTDLPSALSLFTERQDQQLVELLHEFAFYGRKLLELVKREQWESSKYARRLLAAAHREDTEGEVTEAEMSLWDIFGRLIHSDKVSIDRSVVPAADGNETVGEAAWAFNVTSDKDKDGSSTFVFLEFLLVEFLELEQRIRRDLRLSSPATAKHHP